MSNVEHLFENALVALENDYYFGEWKRIEKDRHNTDGVSNEVIEAIWELAIYTKYTYEPSLNAIPIEWMRNYVSIWVSEAYRNFVLNMIATWEKENIIEKQPTVDAEPVRHGKFVGTEYDGYADGCPVYYEWKCSQCGCVFEEDEEPTYKYCPNCGAKMDEE